MLATHSNKLLNAKAQQDAVCANIVDALNPYYVTSQAVKMTKKYWSCPRNAARINIYKDTQPTKYLPDIQDGRAVKQLLIPTQNWRDDEYVSVTPLESLGLLHELYLRLRDANIKHRRFLLEPGIPSRANRGELMVEQKGRLYLLQRRLADIVHDNGRQKVLCVSCMVHDANVTSGFVVHGHPAITAVGGLVHNIERQTQQDIAFAIGLRSVLPGNRKRYNNYVRQAKTKVVWGITSELTATLEVVLLLKADDLPALCQHLTDNPILRFAGGSVWDYQVCITDEPPVANYLIDATGDMGIGSGKDVLDHALTLHNGNPPIYCLNQAGYAFLETPQKRKKARNGYNHAWAEPIYVMTKQSSFTQKAWWHRHLVRNHIVWRGNN